VDVQSSIDSLDNLVRDRHYLHAVRVLRKAEKKIQSSDLVEIGALSATSEKIGKTKTVPLD
jgi:hypothetical protein